MAKDIKQRISLEGGSEFRAALKAIGDDGQKAFDNLRKAAEDSAASAAKVSDQLLEAEKRGRDFGLALRDIADNAKQVAISLADVVKSAGALGAAVFAAAKATANAGDNQIKSAQAAGVSVEQYGRLTHAFEQAGVEASQSSNLFNRLNESIDGTSDSAAKTRAVLAGLGVNAVRLGNGLVDTERLIGDIAARFQDMPDGAEKSRIAIELFGRRAGPRLIPFLNQGREGIKALGDEADRLGITFSTESARASERFNDTLDKLFKSLAGLRNAFAVPFLTPFADAFDSLAETVASFRQPVEDIAKLIRDGLVSAFNALKEVAGPILSALGAALQQVLNVFNSLFGTDITVKHVVVVAAFVAMTGAALKLASAITTILPAISGIIKALTGIPAVISTVVSSVNTLVSICTALTRGFALLSFAIGGIPAALLLIVAAIAIFVATNENARNAVVDAWNSAWGWITGAAQSTFDAVSSIWSGLSDFFLALFSADWVVAVWDTLIQAASGAWEWIKATATEAFDSIVSYLSGTWVGSVINAINKVIEKVREFARIVKSAFSGANSVSGSSGDSAPGFARGGLVRGPGTGTSDSIWAWLSDKEFVQPARAVRHYGVGFMEAIRNLTFPRDFADLLMPAPSFADGGLVSVETGVNRGRPITLILPSGAKAGPMYGDDDTVATLTREANRGIIRATGRKPTWYR